MGCVFGLESNLPDEVLRNRKATREASIEVLAVDREDRRKGIATVLLNRLFDALRRREIDYVSLAVPTEEVGARKLYEKLGFEERAYFLAKRL